MCGRTLSIVIFIIIRCITFHIFGDVVYNIPVIPYYPPCIYFHISRLVLRSVSSVIIYDRTNSHVIGISQSSVVLCSGGVPTYVYIECCTKGHMNFPFGRGIFDIGHFAMVFLLLSFVGVSETDGISFPFLNRIRKSLYNVLFHFSFIDST